MGQVASEMSGDEASDLPIITEENVRAGGESGSSVAAGAGRPRYNLRPRRSDGQSSANEASSTPISTSTSSRTGALERLDSVEARTVRSVLQILAGMGTDDSDDEGDVPWSEDGDTDIDLIESFQSSKRGKSQPIPDPKIVSNLQKSSFAYLTREQLGLDPLVFPQSSTDKETPTAPFEISAKCSILQLLRDREIGGFRLSKFSHFTSGRRNCIMADFLPDYRKTVYRFTQKVFCGTYSQCGDLFMSACQDQKIRLYDTSNGNFRRIRTMQAQNVGWSVLDTVLSPDKRHLVYSSWCDNLYQISLCGQQGIISNVENEEEEDSHTPLQLSDDGSRFCVFSLRFSGDGDEILCGANDGFIYLYDRFQNIRSLKIDGHDDDVNAVSFVDSATHILASGGDDGLVKIWDRRSLRESNPIPVGTFAGHSDGVTYIDSRGDGRHLISNSKDQTIKLWDLRCFSGRESVQQARQVVRLSQNWDYRWQSHPSRRTKRAGKHVVTDDSSIMTYVGHSVLKTLIRCRFSPLHSTGQRFIYSGSGSGHVFIFDALTGKVVKILKGHSGTVRDVSWHPYQPELVSTSWDYSVARWIYKEKIVEDPILRNTRSTSGNREEEGQEPITTKRARRGVLLFGTDD